MRKSRRTVFSYSNSSFRRTLPRPEQSRIIRWTVLIAALCVVAGAARTIPDSRDFVPNTQAENTFVVVPSAQASSEGNINNGFPFNLSMGNSIRYQQVYAASDFSALNGPMLINEIRFRPDVFTGRFSSTLLDIQINLSTTTRTPSSLSTTFADNVGVDDIIVFARGPLALSSSFTGPAAGPKDFDIVITLTTPFLYDPSEGNLLLDVRNFGGGFTTQFDAQVASSDSVARAAIFNSVGSPTGFTDTVGLVTAFNFIPVNSEPVAACADLIVPADVACQAFIAPADLNAGSFDPDTTDTINLSLDNSGPLGLGDHLVTLIATDNHGASSLCQATVMVRDVTPPAVSCPAAIQMILPANTTATSMMVDYPAPTATDNCSTPSIDTSPAPGSVFPVGTTTVNATATDQAGEVSTCGFSVTVLYNFSGFFQPVDNAPMVNAGTAGNAIPVKFSLSGNKGLNILSSIFSQQVSCVSGASTTVIEETVAAGGSSLSYDAALDKYIYVWKTNKAWKGTCRLLTVTLNDGTTHFANFQFK